MSQQHKKKDSFKLTSSQPVVLLILFIVFKFWGLMTMPFPSWKARWVRLADIDKLEERWRRFEYWSKEKVDEQQTSDTPREDIMRGAGKQVVGVDMHAPPTTSFRNIYEAPSSNSNAPTTLDGAEITNHNYYPQIGESQENERVPHVLEIG